MWNAVLEEPQAVVFVSDRSGAALRRRERCLKLAGIPHGIEAERRPSGTYYKLYVRERDAVAALTWRAYAELAAVMAPSAWAGLEGAVRTALASDGGAERIVAERDGFIAYCPYASWQPFEVWLTPTEHFPSFEQSEPEDLDRLAGVLRDVIGRFEPLVPGAAYNMLLRTAPWMKGNDAWSHWRIELLPRINSFAGLEIATGIHINPMPPERAAERFRIY